MKNYTFSNIQGGQSNSFAASLIAAAPAAEIVRFDTRNLKTLSASVKVAGAALTTMVVSARTDLNADFIPVPRTELVGYGRSDSSTDIGTTPIGATAAIRMDVEYWAEVKIECTSAGTTTAGVQ